MLKSVRYLVIGLILSLAAASAFAQNHPMPGSKSEQPVICNGCPWNNIHGQANDGLPTYPYSGVLVKHVGRYVDSSSVQSFQNWANGFRTARARFIRVAPTTRGSAPPRVYIQIGNAMMAYSLDTFFTTRLPGGMIPLVNKFSGIGGGRERVLDWDGFVYPEHAQSGWQTDGGDFQDPMAKAVPFDYDDRGNVYVATEKFGWSIVTDDGRSNGTHLQKVIQFVATPNPEFTKVLANTSKVKSESIISIKTGGSYYAIIADRDSQMAVFDATNASRPVVTSTRTGDKKNAVRAVARDDNTKRVAYIDNNFDLRIFDYDSLVSGGAPIAEYSGENGKFGEVLSMDEQGNIWAVESNGKIWKLTPSGNTYTKATFTPFSGVFQPLMMNVAAGYMAIGGIDRTALTYDVKLLRVESNGVSDLNIDNFFRKYYHQPPVGYAQPGSYTAIQAQSADIEVVKWGGKTYLLYSGFGLGDVFELEGGNSINISVKGAPFGTPNPNAKSTEPGPFYGDPVTFSAASSSASVNYDVLWDFANPQAGTGNSGRRSRTGADITHQFTGITAAGTITAPKLIQAQTVQDPNIRAQHQLLLKLPVPRVGFARPGTPSSALPATVTANTSGLVLVPGDLFVDASDGSVEGHVGVWTIDNTTVGLKPNESLPVGDVGAHSLTFRASYGAYDSVLNVNNPYQSPTLSIGYVVRPFKATINTPTTDGTNVTFTATPLFTNNANIMSATTWDVVWTVNGTPVSTAGGVGTSAVGEAIGTIRPLIVPRSSITDGTQVGLTINVDPTKLSTAAAAYAQYATSLTLSTPDPDIEVTGCANANSPCKFTARSVNGKSMAGWTYLWTLTRPSGSPLTGTGATFEPSLSAGGNYTITLKATTSIFPVEVSKQLTVGASLCGPLPQSHTVGISKIGCSTSCTPGTTVEFAPTFLGYARQACDSYVWNMGDGSAAKPGEVVSHTFNSPGTYTITMTMSNSSSSTPLVKQTTVTINNGTTDPPPTNVCTAPVNITVSATCNGGATCRTSDTITFTARRGGASLQSCDNVQWSFGDGTQSTQRQPQKTYASAGTYNVSAIVSNSAGTAPAATTQVTVADPTGNCGIAPSIGNFVIEFVGPTSNCRQFNGISCNAGESVAFTAPNYYYVVGSCDTFEWDFDDGTPKSNDRNPTHSFAGGRTYNVKLTVRNGAGNYTYERNVPVAGNTPTQPIPVITANFPANGRKGQAVTFVATSNTANTTGWTWNFGDGTSINSSQAGNVAATSTITHTFTSTGTFTVRVSARNSLDAPNVQPGEAQGSIVITEAPAIPEYRYLLPVTAYTAGQGGSAWRTDVQIYHSDPQVSETKPLIMEATFKGITKTLTMIKATHIYENFLGNLLDLQKEDQGPVIITTKNSMTPPQIWTRTYTQTANGTFGQFIPAIRIDNVGGGGAVDGSVYYMAGLRHDARYRTNVGFLNPTLAPLQATVTVYDSAKFKIGEFPLTLQPFQLDQFQLKSRVPNLPDDEPFSVKIDVTTANAWIVGYGSFLDGMSNDPVYVEALPESEVASADYKTTILPGVGHVGQWRSDVTIFNPDSDGVTFDLTYYNSLGDKKAEATVSLDSGKFLQYGDILKQGVLGNVADGLGTLKVTVQGNHEKYPMTFARTYFDNGANGTFGQGIPSFSPARANVRPGQHAIIAGVRNNPEYYTNIGLVNVSASNVTATITLLDPTTGAAVKSIQYTVKPAETIVGPFAATQAQPRGDWNGITTATLKIEANGALWAFCSIIDAKTSDPEYVKAQPVVTP